MRSFVFPVTLILVLTALLAMTRPDCEDSILKSRLTEIAFFGIFVFAAALSSTQSKSRKILTPFAVGAVGIPASAALWIMIVWPVWRIGFLWDVYFKVLPTQLLWMIPTMILTALIMKAFLPQIRKCLTKRFTIYALLAVVFGVGFFLAASPLTQQNLQWELSHAAGDGDLAAVQRFVEAGAIIDATPFRANRAVSGLPALTVASLNGHEEVVRYLLDNGADPNLSGMSNPLIAACWRKHYSIAKLLLERGADPNARGEGTPLYAAKSTGQPKLVLLLQEHGAHD